MADGKAARFVNNLLALSSLEQLDDNLAAAELTLSQEHIAELDDASAFELGYPYEMIQEYQGPW